MKAFIIFRDRLAYGRRCLLAMRRAGLEPVVVDHGSTWPAALAWLDHLDRAGVTVLRRGGGHPRDMFSWQPFRDARGTRERFVVTDPDVVPTAECPLTWPQKLSWLLDQYPAAVKIGMALRTDNLPAHYSRRQQVIDWEAQFAQPQNEARPGVFWAPVDTTLALYPAGSEFILAGAMRTALPYAADHLAWYENLEDLTPEQRYYYEHTEPGISHWAAHGHSVWAD